MTNYLYLLVAIALFASSSASRAEDRGPWRKRAAQTIEDYVPVKGLVGKLTLVGSDTMKPLLDNLVIEFRGMYPQVAIDVEAKGSATAIPALIKGNSSFGPMVRQPNPAEAAAFEATYGYKPTTMAIAIETTVGKPPARFLYLTFNRNPSRSLDPVRSEFLKFVYSMQGQECVAQAGLVPLTRDMIQRQIRQAGN